jgi:hypothetical protein
MLSISLIKKVVIKREKTRYRTRLRYAIAYKNIVFLTLNVKRIWRVINDLKIKKKEEEDGWLILLCAFNVEICR